MAEVGNTLGGAKEKSAIKLVIKCAVVARGHSDETSNRTALPDNFSFHCQLRECFGLAYDGL
jgi:hypothetical protein